MTSPDEVVAIADRILHLEGAMNTYQSATLSNKPGVGLIGRLVERIRAHRIERVAEEAGLLIVGDSVVVPKVVSQEYFNAVEDN